MKYNTKRAICNGLRSFLSTIHFSWISLSRAFFLFIFFVLMLCNKKRTKCRKKQLETKCNSRLIANASIEWMSNTKTKTLSHSNALFLWVQQRKQQKVEIAIRLIFITMHCDKNRFFFKQKISFTDHQWRLQQQQTVLPQTEKFDLSRKNRRRKRKKYQNWAKFICVITQTKQHSSNNKFEKRRSGKHTYFIIISW